MEKMDEYFQAQKTDDFIGAQQALEQALALEMRAAHLVPESSEPTRSVLLRSAATIALYAGQEQQALQIIATALRGQPPKALKKELCELLEQTSRTEEINANIPYAPTGSLVQEVIIRNGTTGRKRVPLRLANRVQELWESLFTAIAKVQSSGLNPRLYPVGARQGSYRVHLDIRVPQSAVASAIDLMRKISKLVDSFSLANINQRADELGVSGLEALETLASVLERNQASVDIKLFQHGTHVPGVEVEFPTPSSQTVRQLKDISTEYVNSSDVPQADDFDKVLRVVDITYAGMQPTPENLHIVQRQLRYYRHAAEVMGYVEDDVLTAQGQWIARLKDQQEERLHRAALQFEVTRIAQAWMRWNRVDTLDETDPESAFQFLEARAFGLSESTKKRRAKTLVSWHKQLIQSQARR